MARKLSGTDAIVFNMVNEEAVDRLRRNGLIKLPDKKVDIPKDMRWNEKFFASTVLQALERGDSSRDIAKAIFPEIMSKGGVVKRNQDSAIRNARTMFTSAENNGRLDSMKELADQGVVMKKVWESTPDDRTRPSHVDIDGEEQDINTVFSNGCMFPGDGKGPAEEVWMCRCAMHTHIIGFKNSKGEVSKVNYERDRTLHDEQMEEEKARRGAGKTTSSTLSTSIGSLSKPQRPRVADFGGYTEEWEHARAVYQKQREAYDAEIDRAIQAVNKNTAFQSIDDAKQWAKDNGIVIKDEVFNKVDLKAFNEVKPTLEEMFERFPEIKNFTFEYHDGSVFKRDFWIGLTDDGLLSANGGFNFNPFYFSDPDYGVKQGLDQITEGVLVRGDGSFKTLVRHEYGHNVQEYIEHKIADKYHYNIDDWRKNFTKFDDFQKATDAYRAEIKQYRSELHALAKIKGASEYSSTNELELFAEGFADYTSGGTSDFAKAFGAFLRRWY